MAKFPVSVIIPTMEREEITLATLKSFENQTFINFELIVLDQTTPPSEQLSTFNSNVYYYRYHHIRQKSLPNARNVAAKIAQGAILIFVDDDVIPAPDLVSSYINEFETHDDSVWVIGGRVYEAHTKIMSERSNISGGYITNYGKTLKNFSAEDYSECDWVVGCNFAVRKRRYLEIGGFDTNYIGNAMLEDGDFCFCVRSNGGRVIFSPKPQLEHLRAKSGGTRQLNMDLGMFYRSHNTVYFFRKHHKHRYLPIVFFYLNGVALKDFIQRKHSFKSFFCGLKGFVMGFGTTIRN
ncbi:MAG: glycosyltransferase family 2 protein [bacterium]